MPYSADNSAALPTLTREQVRNVDRRAIEQYGMSGLVLMENAGRNSAELLRSLGIVGRVVVCCGKGNNGGDGFVIARHLEVAGVDVKVVLCVTPDSVMGDAATNLRILQLSRTPIVLPPFDWKTELKGAEWVVDALLGTGTVGQIREPFVSAVTAINSVHTKVFAVDLPSGLDCDLGAPTGGNLQDLEATNVRRGQGVRYETRCVRAEHTATFVARKVGFDRPESNQWTGRVHVVEIGIPLTLLREIGVG